MSEHGASRYTNHGCRCIECRAANTAKMNAYNHRTGRHRPRWEYLADLRTAPPPPHGTESRYTKRGCRCDDCKRASREARARRRAKVAA